MVFYQNLNRLLKFPGELTYVTLSIFQFAKLLLLIFCCVNTIYKIEPACEVMASSKPRYIY